MAKKLIDANVILRYLLRDEETLFQKASALLEKVKTGEDKVVILESVLAECVYVLLKIYKVNRSTIAEKLRSLFYYKGVADNVQDIVYYWSLTIEQPQSVLSWKPNFSRWCS